jgi:hypothetical protein
MKAEPFWRELDPRFNEGKRIPPTFVGGIS